MRQTRQQTGTGFRQQQWHSGTRRLRERNCGDQNVCSKTQAKRRLRRAQWKNAAVRRRIRREGAHAKDSASRLSEIAFAAPSLENFRFLRFVGTWACKSAICAYDDVIELVRVGRRSHVVLPARRSQARTSGCDHAAAPLRNRVFVTAVAFS